MLSSEIEFIGQGFTTGSGNPVGNQLIRLLTDSRFHAFTWFSAFASESAIVGLSKYIEQAKANYRSMNIIVGVDQKGTSKEALEAILNLGVNAFVFYQPAFSIFHPKIYLFEGEEISEMIVGSSNLTAQGLFANVEASLMVSSKHTSGENPEVIAKLKTYFKGIFDLTDPNLKPLTYELIEHLVLARIVPTEQERQNIQDKSGDAEQDQTSSPVSSLFPKRKISPVPSEFRIKREGDNQAGEEPISFPDSKGDIAAFGELVWSKRKLSSSDTQFAKEGTKPTGALRLVQSGFEVDEHIIDQTVYFRNTLFGRFEWKKVTDNPFVEVAKIPFVAVINGGNSGEFRLEVRHKPSGEAGQGNYTTSISWGELGGIIRNSNLIGAQLDLYAPLHEGDPFIIKIS